MKPAFKTAIAWEQAQLLMQPALIRVVDNLRKQIEDSPWQATYQETQVPVPGFQVCLTRGERSLIYDIWHLCFQVCFAEYPKAGETSADDGDFPVDIDPTLLDDTGEVDWQQLENKTQQVVRDLFAQLPSDN
jgi:hypothetical protein